MGDRALNKLFRIVVSQLLKCSLPTAILGSLSGLSIQARGPKEELVGISPK